MRARVNLPNCSHREIIRVGMSTTSGLCSLNSRTDVRWRRLRPRPRLGKQMQKRRNDKAEAACGTVFLNAQGARSVIATFWLLSIRACFLPGVGQDVEASWSGPLSADLAMTTSKLVPSSPSRWAVNPSGLASALRWERKYTRLALNYGDRALMRDVDGWKLI